jgi:uncharacterized protein YndB with AHSA1/START domain
MEGRPGDLSLRVERVMPAPRARIFTLHSEPDQWARWWGPNGFSVSRIEAELRVGGSFRIAMKPPDGEGFVLAGEFLRIDDPTELSYTFRWEDPDPDDQENVVRFLLGDAGDSTNVAVDQGPFLTEARRALHVQGWTETLDRLYRLVVNERP